MTLSLQEIYKWVNYLEQESDEAYETSLDLFKSKRYNFSLFFCHLALEKIIKACFLPHKKKFAPPVHDLIYLIKRTGIGVGKDELEKLGEINTFNIKARYEDYKREFYTKATKEYSEKWIRITKDLLIYFGKEI